MSLLRKALLALSENSRLFEFIKNHRFSRNMTRRFIAGESLEEAILAIRQLNAKGKLATFVHLGENVSTHEEAIGATRAYLHILEQIQETDLQSNISLKLTVLGLDLSEDFCYENLKKIVAKADQFNNFIRIDMEGSAYTDRTLKIFNRVYAEFKNVGVVIQAYLYRSEKDIDDLIRLKARIRLCKGAYHEPASIAFPKRKQVDENFILLMKKLLLHGNYPGIATHDLGMIDEAKRFARENNIHPSRFEFQMLYGIRRELAQILVSDGYNLRIYVPYGEQWYPYFMRRLAERPANLLFFLTSLFRG